MSPLVVTLAFLVAAGATVFIKLGLVHRQIRHVLAHRGDVPPPFADTISLASHQKAADYTAARMRLARWDTLASLAYVLALTLGGGLGALHELTGRFVETGSLAHGITLLGALGVLGWVLDLPFALYRTFSVEKRFGFNRMTPALFIADTAREAALAVLIGVPVLAAVLWLMGTMGERWWFWVWAFWIAFNLLGLFIFPTFIAPLFNKFTPLADEALKTRVEALLARCGFRAKGLYVMDGSRRSAHGNAYFTGFGTARRIVFFDTLLEKLAPEEIEAVLAHELGHFHHRHIWKRFLPLAAVSLGMLWLLGWLMQQPAFFAGLGFPPEAKDTASALALFALALPFFTFLLAPLMSHWSRVHEYEADRYAARQTRAEDLVQALVKLYRDNASTLTPDPLYSAFFDSHPPAALRVAQLRAPH